MVGTTTSFSLRSLTLRCVASRDEPELSEAAVFQRVRDAMDRVSVAYELVRGTGLIRFRRTWRTPGYWMPMANSGRIQVHSTGSTTVVDVSVSLLPLLTGSVALGAVIAAVGPAWILGVFIVWGVGGSLFNVYRSVRSLAASGVRL